ncbi:MAG: lytic transglycosylase domain-containing protein [Elusimicrobia bacterium]|nr:lytic transglycosylase domain-containing protein [Elusimicrobiota bacterium]
MVNRYVIRTFETNLYGYGLGLFLVAAGSAVLSFYTLAVIQSWVAGRGTVPLIMTESSAGEAVYRGVIRDTQTPTWIHRLLHSENFYRHDVLIWDAAAKHSIDPNLWKAVVMVESAGNSEATSRVGAMGLSQIMPITARSMGLQTHQFYDPRSNLQAGAKYMSSLIRRFGGRMDLALAGYNAGPTLVDDHRKIPSYKETQKFVESVLALYRWLQKNPETWAMIPAGSEAISEVPRQFQWVSIRLAQL